VQESRRRDYEGGRRHIQGLAKSRWPSKASSALSTSLMGSSTMKQGGSHRKRRKAIYAKSHCRCTFNGRPSLLAANRVQDAALPINITPRFRNSGAFVCQRWRIFGPHGAADNGRLGEASRRKSKLDSRKALSNTEDGEANGESAESRLPLKCEAQDLRKVRHSQPTI
jgi:hypothetical protein